MMRATPRRSAFWRASSARAQIAALTPGCEVALVPVGTAGNADIIQTFGAEWLTDLEISWDVTPTVRLSLGAQNLFDVYPDENIASSVASVAAGTNGAAKSGAQPYDAVSPFGFNG